MKIHVAGKITGLDNFKELFAEATKKLEEDGHVVMNPAVLPKGFDHGEYMKICYSMIDVCEAVYFLDNWYDSVGAKMEYDYARSKNKDMIFQKEIIIITRTKTKEEKDESKHYNWQIG